MISNTNSSIHHRSNAPEETPYTWVVTVVTTTSLPVHIVYCEAKYLVLRPPLPHMHYYMWSSTCSLDP